MLALEQVALLAWGTVIVILLQGLEEAGQSRESRVERASFVCCMCVHP